MVGFDFLKIEKVLGSLTEKESDFYNFSRKNFNFLLNSTISSVAKKFGTGNSFIYSFFNKINVSSLKEYIYFLGYVEGKSSLSLKSYLNEFALKNANFIKMQVETKESFETNFKLMLSQDLVIQRMVDLLLSTKDVFFLGFGHSKLAINEFLSFYWQINKSSKLITDENWNFEEIVDSITEKSIIVIYTIRGTNEKLTKIVEKINKKYKDVEFFLITSNIFSPVSKIVKNTILVDNIMSRFDFFSQEFILSPIIPLILTNQYLKTLIFNDDAIKIRQNLNLKSEFLSWIDKKINV